MINKPVGISPETIFRGSASHSAIPDRDWFNELIHRTTQTHTAPAFIHVEEARLAKPDALINLAVRNPDVRAFVTSAAALGYLQYFGVEGEARLVHRSRLSQLWNAVRTGNVRESADGIFYTLDHRLPEKEIKRLLVVFSGVALAPRSPSLWRYFEKNFRHVDANIPGDTAVLRIADVGGVLGAFYMNTADHPHATLGIESLITSTADKFSISRPQICLLGSSKGASGATHYGISLGTHFVAVEPILSDAYYEDHLHDIHFTAPSIFPDRKADIFQSLSGARENNSLPGYIFTSPASPQYPYISSFQNKTPEINLVTTRDSRIVDHPDVARTVLGPTLSLVNSILLGWPTPPRSVEI